MNEIISMLERADGPSRDFDGSIALALGWTRQKMKGDQRPYWRKPGVTQYYIREEDGPPAYTTSMDVAVSLIPAGLYWTAAFGKCRDDEPVGACQIFDPRDPTSPIAEAEGHSVHIAICIAALKTAEH